MQNQEHSQEVKQSLLEQGIHELNDDELEMVAGGNLLSAAKDVGKVEQETGQAAKKSGGGFKHMAIGAAASYFIPHLLFGGGSSSQGQSQSTTTTTQG